MAFALTCEIQAGPIRLTGCHAVRVESSWKTLTDTAEVQFAARGVLKSTAEVRPVRLEDVLHAGMTITVDCGYDGRNRRIFEGYIAEVVAGYPLTLRCEDYSYALKREGNITKSYRTVSIAALIAELEPEVQAGGLPGVTLENFMVERATKAKVLQELKDKYGLAVYFRGSQLYAGLPYTTERFGVVPRFRIPGNVAEEQLVYRRAEDVRLKAKAISVEANGKRIEVEVGDPDGDERTLHYYKVGSPETLRQLANADLARYKYEGFRGSFTAFGVPAVQHTQTVEIIDLRYPDRVGRYLVDKVVSEFGQSGFRQHIELGTKVSLNG